MSRRFLILAAAAALTLAGCSLLISGKDEGRPCKDGACPSGFACVNDACLRMTVFNDGGTDGGTDGGPTCTTPADCGACATGQAVCGVDGQCGCADLLGGFSSIGEATGSGSFVIGGAQLGNLSCGTKDIYKLCGGFSQ